MPLSRPAILKTISNAAAGFFAARVIIMVCTLAVVYLNTAYLGTEGQGTASLIIFGILLILSLSNFIGGGALVYLIPRMPTGATALPGIVWAVLSAIIFYPVLLLTHWVPSEFVVHTCVLGAIQSLYVYLAQITLAHQHAKAYNAGVALQSTSQVAAMYVFYDVLNSASSHSLILSMYCSFTLTLLWFVACTAHYWKEIFTAHHRDHWKEMLRLGKFTQGGNILHLLNQRFNAVLLNQLSGAAGRSLAGLYSIALYAAEAIWTVAKSLSFDLYSRISNTTDVVEHHKSVSEYLRIVHRVSAVAVVVVVLVPQALYEWIFTKELPHLRIALLLFLPGIVCNGASIIYAHFFSGTGRHRLNFYGSAIGFIVGVSTALLCIPQWGLLGGTAAASMAFVAQWIFHYLRYRSIKNEEVAHTAQARV